MGKDLSTSGTNEKELKTFLQYLTKLDFTQFCGVCRMVGVDIIQASDSEAGRELKDFDQLLEEAIDGFCFLSRKRRKNLLKALKVEIKEMKKGK